MYGRFVGGDHSQIRSARIFSDYDRALRWPPTSSLARTWRAIALAAKNSDTFYVLGSGAYAGRNPFSAQRWTRTLYAVRASTDERTDRNLDRSVATSLATVGNRREYLPDGAPFVSHA